MGCPCSLCGQHTFWGAGSPTEVMLSPLPVPADRAAAVAGGATQGALQAAGGRAGEAAAAAQHRAGKGTLQLGSRAPVAPAGQAQAATLTALLFLRRS